MNYSTRQATIAKSLKPDLVSRNDSELLNLEVQGLDATVLEAISMLSPAAKLKLIGQLSNEVYSEL